MLLHYSSSDLVVTALLMSFTFDVGIATSLLFKHQSELNIDVLVPPIEFTPSRMLYNVYSLPTWEDIINL